MNSRQIYLSKYWSHYPESTVDPEGLTFCGEVLRIEIQGGTFQIVLGQQRGVEVVRARKAQLAQTELSPELVLIPGDKISMRKSGDEISIVLMAPNLLEGGEPPLNSRILEGWNQFLEVIRSFWVEQEFLEIETPSLVFCPGFESTIRPFEVKRHEKKPDLFLPTSPEIHLKKALSRGLTKIFEIRSCFRDDETSATHQPEFKMLEWYRSYTVFDHLRQDLNQLLQRLEQEKLIEGQLLPMQTVTVAECFQRVYDFELTPQTSLTQLSALADEKLKYKSFDGESWSDLYHRLWVEKIDPWLSEFQEPLFVVYFPPSEAALARLNSSGWAERAELYWRGLEIANGYNELNDPVEQRKRSEATPHFGHDEEFFRALERGMPPGVGMALGLERLFMAAQKLDDIRRLKANPY